MDEELSNYKNFTYRLYPTTSQEKVLFKYVGACRWLWNRLLQDRIDFYKTTKKSKSFVEQSRMLPIFKKEFPWLKEIPASTLVEVATKLDLAYKAFFKKGGFPKNKSRYKGSQSFSLRGSYFPETSINCKHNATFTVNNFGISLPKPRGTLDIGYIKMMEAEKICNDPIIHPKSAIISFHHNKWFCSLLCEIDKEFPTTNDKPNIGIDFGIKQDYTTSNGDALFLPHKTKDETKKLKKLQRQLARKSKGGKNFRKLNAKLSKLLEKHAVCKKDALHKMTTTLAVNHNKICVEDIKLANMTKSAKGTVENPGSNVKQKAGLNREVLDRNFGEFRQMLEYKTKDNGGELIKVNPAYTSQTCSKCGHCESGNRTTQENFTCLRCGITYNADTNAARNILRLGTGGQSGIVSGVVGSVCSSKDANTTQEVLTTGDDKQLAMKNIGTE